MKVMAFLMIVMYLMLPVACFAQPCASCVGSPDIVDTTGSTGTHSHDQDADGCDSTFCCAELVTEQPTISSNYAPLISRYLVPEQRVSFPQTVFPIFIPPQNLS